MNITSFNSFGSRDIDNFDRTVIVCYKGLGVHKFHYPSRDWIRQPRVINAFVCANLIVKSFLMRMKYD